MCSLPEAASSLLTISRSGTIPAATAALSGSLRTSPTFVHRARASDTDWSSVSSSDAGTAADG